MSDFAIAIPSILPGYDCAPHESKTRENEEAVSEISTVDCRDIIEEIAGSCLDSQTSAKLLSITLAKSADFDSMLANAIKSTDPVDVLRSALELGDDATVSLARSILRQMRGAAWPAWHSVAFDELGDEAVAFVDDIVDCEVVDYGFSRTVFEQLAAHLNAEVPELLLDRIGDLEPDIARSVIRICAESDDDSIRSRANEISDDLGM